MGSDPAPFMANLSPFYYEDKQIKKTTLQDLIEARKFNMFWFIDDLAAINDGEFEKVCHETYPPELELKRENRSNTDQIQDIFFRSGH